MSGMDDIMKEFSIKPQAEKSAQPQSQPKPPTKKPIMNMGNDMADILKAIEADPSNMGE